ncbi:MAG: transposase [Treponema sp.]|nr:transposase [Treponema sp.]
MPVAQCFQLPFERFKKRFGAHVVPAIALAAHALPYCRLQKRCKKGAGNRGIERNERRLRLKRKAKGILEDEQYRELRKRRSVEVETIFGQINRTKVCGNQGYRRFLLRGISKVSTEWG